MLTFLFEQYGYYPKEIDSYSFVIDNWKFKLIETEHDAEYINKIDEYLQLIRNNFKDKGPYIIKTRFGNTISVFDNKKYVLVSVRQGKLSLKDMNKFHHLFKEQGRKVNLKSLFSTWEERITLIESVAINALRIDSVYYKKNLEISMFCLGLAQNAMQYLSEMIMDFDEMIDDVTLTHKRLFSLDAFDFFNPFNFIVDHPIRDIIELYKSNFIHFSDLIEILEYYRLDSKIASLFMARILYPAEILDMLDENSLKKNPGFKIQYCIDLEIAKIKKIYIFLKQKHSIRPIDWLDV